MQRIIAFCSYWDTTNAARVGSETPQDSEPTQYCVPSFPDFPRDYAGFSSECDLQTALSEIARDISLVASEIARDISTCDIRRDLYDSAHRPTPRIMIVGTVRSSR